MVPLVLCASGYVAWRCSRSIAFDEIDAARNCAIPVVGLVAAALICLYAYWCTPHRSKLVGGRNTNWVLPYCLIIVERKKGFEESRPALCRRIWRRVL